MNFPQGEIPKDKITAHSSTAGGSRQQGEWDSNVLSPRPGKMDAAFRLQVIASYRRLLDRCSSGVKRESDLPFPKDTIRGAICQELLENPCSESRSYLEIAYARLESFTTREEYEVMETFKQATFLAQHLSENGDPRGIIASARVLKNACGDIAVRIQEEISENMQRRLRQIRRLGTACGASSANRCALGFAC